MKTIYFVRHGESEGNVKNLYQGHAEPLTEKGRSQASIIAERCAALPIEVVVSSMAKRAQETADVIAKKLRKPIEHSDLFIERRRAKEQIGKSAEDPEAKRIMRLIKENFEVPGYRFSDEENFEDLRSRAIKALHFLEQRSENNILVITHGLFLRVLLASVIFGKDLTARECQKILDAFYTQNTGMTVFGLEEEENQPPAWWIWIWNDHAHLG